MCSVESDLVSLFEKIGLKKEKAIETAKNGVLSKRLETLIRMMKLNNEAGDMDPRTGTLLYVASSLPLSEPQLTCLVELIRCKKIHSTAQVKALADYFKKNIQESIDFASLEAACGIGVVYSNQEIEEAVRKALSRIKISAKGETKKPNYGPVIGAVLNDYKWADVEKIEKMIEAELMKKEDVNKATVGAGDGCSNVEESLKTEESDHHSASVSDTGFKDWKSVISAIDPKRVYSTGEAGKFHKPGQNYTSPNYVVTASTARLMDEHLKKYGSQVRMRFPPEPNGILHIGHAKAININFGYAKAFDGITFLRYDDTNPEKEEERFFLGIQEMVEWLGFTPYKITSTSDYFDELYEFAKVLIRKGVAYVCHEPPEAIKGRSCPASAWRDRPASESLDLFEDMKNGKFDEGKAVLRLKYVMEDGKTDPVAYRILYVPHHRTGSKWCIYPTYSYSHPITDSLEGITHSLCTKEFQNQRSFYYWLCNTLDIYCPVQWEYSRLNLSYSVVSKRKILKLIESKIVADWDDPRLFTLSALRNRGVPKEAINYFCHKVGVTMAQNVINPIMLYSCVREVLNVMAPRAMAVLQPLKVTITNLPNTIQLSAPKFPFDVTRGTRSLLFGAEIYIDRNDFKEDADADYRRLTPTQHVGLMHVGKVLRFQKAIKDDDGNIIQLLCTLEEIDVLKKPQAFIHWIHDGVSCEVRIYEELFLHPHPEDPKEVPGGFLSDINPNSIKVMKHALVERGVEDADYLSRFQFERLGYFCVSKNSSPQRLVFNRIVTLR